MKPFRPLPRIPLLLKEYQRIMILHNMNGKSMDMDLESSSGSCSISANKWRKGTLHEWPSDSSSSCSLEERENGLSYAETLVNFCKGMIGPGCLSLPLAFRQAGLWTGLFLVFFLGFLNLICMHKLVKCSQQLSKSKGNSFLNYGNVALESFASTFTPFRRFNRLAKFVVNASLISLQMGICGVFYVFCAVHLKEFFDEEHSTVALSNVQWMLAIFVPMALINFIRSLRLIAVLSSAGNLFCIVALSFIFQYLIRAPHHADSLPWFTTFDGAFTACGSILYSFEGQAMVLPLENRLKRPSQMLGPAGVLSTGIGIISLVYAASGFLGYTTYGAQVHGSITLNLPQRELQFVVVKLLFTLVIYIGFVIQMYVVVDMLWPELNRLLDRVPNAKLGAELFFRAGLVAIAMSLAIAVPELDRIIPLIGATTGMLLALVFPSLLDLLTFLPIHLGKGRTLKAALCLAEDLALIAVGLFGLFAGIRANAKTLFGGQSIEQGLHNNISSSVLNFNY